MIELIILLSIYLIIINNRYILSINNYYFVSKSIILRILAIVDLKLININYYLAIFMKERLLNDK